MIKKITISDIEQIYKQYNIEKTEFHLMDDHFFKRKLRKDLLSVIENLTIDYDIFDFYPFFNHDQNTEESLKKRKKDREIIKKEFKKQFLTNIKDEEQLGFLNIVYLKESLSCLDNALYWFLNYRLNCTRFTIKAGIQALYYSEFFAQLAVAEFLGLAITFLPEIGQTFKITRFRQKSNQNFQIRVEPFKKNSHVARYDAIRKFFHNYIDLSLTPEIDDLFNDKYFKSLLKEDREVYVYDISERQNYPWEYSYWSGREQNIMGEYRQNRCFLDGQESFNNDNIPENPSGYNEYIKSSYRNWGYEEHHIGSLIKWIIERLHNIKAFSHLKRTKSNLDNFMCGDRPDTIKEPIEIFISWLKFDSN